MIVLAAFIIARAAHNASDKGVLIHLRAVQQGIEANAIDCFDQDSSLWRYEARLRCFSTHIELSLDTVVHCIDCIITLYCLRLALR
jgi:hypothetical protein